MWETAATATAAPKPAQERVSVLDPSSPWDAEGTLRHHMRCPLWDNMGWGVVRTIVCFPANPS